MKVLHYFVGFIVLFCTLLVALLTSVDAVIFHFPNYFETEYQKYDISSATQIELTDLLMITDNLKDYLLDKRDNLDMTAKIDNQTREVFNEREKAHMVDVKNLFSIAIQIRIKLFTVLLLSLAILIFLKADCYRILCRVFQWGCSICLISFVFFTGIIASDFSNSFTIFHEILFTNDLWLLNPQTSILINMVPEPFFIDTAFRIAIVFFVSVAVMLLLSMIIGRATRRFQES